MDKTMYDIFHLGSCVVHNGIQYKLDEVMILGTPENQYTVLKFYGDNNKFAIYGVDLETNKLSSLSLEQVILYKNALQYHKKRLINGNVDRILGYKDDSFSYEYKDILKKIFYKNNINTCSSKLSIGDTEYKFDWFSFLYNKKGSTLVVTIPVLEMAECLSKKPLYEDVIFSTSLSDDIIKYSGNVVRVEKSTAAYVLYIHPYSMEIMQATQCSNTTFENISNPFAVMDFIINHSNSDITGIVYPDSNNKHVHEYIVAGILKNIDIDIENCVIGKVRIGKQIDVSESFESSISDLSEEHTTFAWVSLKSDSLYNAFSEGKKLLIVATEFLAFMVKNDMCADWFGTVDIGNNVWDVRSHYPKITLGNVFYIENCILGESITLTDKNILLPNAIKLNENAEYLFDYDWVENFFRKLQTENKKVLRLQYAMRWIVQAWDTENAYDKLIYCSMALEFIVNGEKGENIFDEFAIKVGRKKFTKEERKEIINKLIEKINLETLEGYCDSDIEKLNTSISNIIRNKLTETNFGTKLECLISRLNIPVSKEELEFLNKSRKSRNKLIHGLEMASISTLQAKKLCGITSRILMYKIIDELGKDVNQ